VASGPAPESLRTASSASKAPGIATSYSWTDINPSGRLVVTRTIPPFGDALSIMHGRWQRSLTPSTHVKVPCFETDPLPDFLVPRSSSVRSARFTHFSEVRKSVLPSRGSGPPQRTVGDRPVILGVALGKHRFAPVASDGCAWAAQKKRGLRSGRPETEFRRDAVPWGTRRRRRLGKGQRLPYGAVQEERTPAEGAHHISARVSRKPDSGNT